MAESAFCPAGVSNDRNVATSSSATQNAAVDFAASLAPAATGTKEVWEEPPITMQVGTPGKRSEIVLHSSIFHSGLIQIAPWTSARKAKKNVTEAVRIELTRRCMACWPLGSRAGRMPRTARFAPVADLWQSEFEIIERNRLKAVLYGPRFTPEEGSFCVQTRQFLGNKDVQAHLMKAGTFAAYQSPGQMAARKRGDYEKWGKVVRDKGVTAE